MAHIFLSLGSNLGDRPLNIARAIKELKKAVKFSASSSFYQTEPIGNKNQPWFLNMALGGETEKSPQELLELIKEIERLAGRNVNDPDSSAAPRPIDIDILFYGDVMLSMSKDDDLTIPHPRLHLRRFVLEPLTEIAPDFTHPILHKSIKELLKDCTDHSIVRKL